MIKAQTKRALGIIITIMGRKEVGRERKGSLPPPLPLSLPGKAWWSPAIE